MSINTRSETLRRLPIVSDMSTEDYQAVWNELKDSFPFAIPNMCRQTKGEVKRGAKKKKSVEEEEKEEEVVEDEGTARRESAIGGGGEGAFTSLPEGRGRPAPGSYISTAVAADMAHVTAMERAAAVLPQATM